MVPIQAVLTWGAGGALRVSGAQRTVAMTDEYWDDPTFSSVRYPGEVRLAPPGTDVVVVGEAHAPGARPTTNVDVLVRVGPVQQAARVVGDRVWAHGIVGMRPSTAKPFVTVPLRHERAVGGPEEPANPIGSGLRGGRSDHQLVGVPLPNLEAHKHPLESPDQRPTPIGFGAIPPAWLPRRAHAGTYDDAWRRDRAPYLPRDFDPRFFHAAAAGLTTRAPLCGGEPVELHNLSPRGRDVFSVPACPVRVAVRLARELQRPSLQLVTVLLDPSNAEVSLVWHAELTCDGRALHIDEVHIDLVPNPTLGGL